MHQTLLISGPVTASVNIQNGQLVSNNKTLLKEHSISLVMDQHSGMEATHLLAGN